MNCPHCQQALPADEMVRCPHCGQPLAAQPGNIDSPGDSSATLSSEEADGFSSLSSETLLSDEIPDQEHSAQSPSSPDDSQVDATFISDEFPEQEAARVEATIDIDAPDASDLADRTVELPSDGSSDQEDDPGRTIRSEEFEDAAQATISDVTGQARDEAVDATIQSDDSPDSSRTLLSDQIDSSDRTIVSDSYSDGSSQTMLSDAAPSEAEIKTLESNWPPSEEDHPRMTIKSRGEVSMEDSQIFGNSLTAVPRRTLRPSGQKSADRELQMPEYELVKVLGEGGMGVVWSARQTSVDRSVAVKMIKGPYASKRSQRQKFLAEAIVTGDLDHPNIVPIYDVGTDTGGTLFYSMKQVKGTPWLKVIKEKSLNENLEILLRVSDAVSFSHSRNIVHRDLKPENVMLGEYGEVLVMDWGLALTLGDLDKARQLRQSTSMGGTPAYMAPEMATGPIDRISPLSDQYLLGAILWEIITGRPPHPGKKVQECLLAAMRNQITETDKSGELVDIARRAMATTPQDRYPTVRDFQQAIREYLAHSESITMSARAAEDLELARGTDAYPDYAKAVFGFEEAFELWDQNQTARRGIDSARLAYAESALRKGDYDLGVSLLQEDHPEHQAVLGQLRAARDERDARQHRLRLAKRLMIGMATCIFLIVTGAFFWINAERQKTEQARQKEEVAKEEALAAKDQEAEQRMKAEQATSAALAAKAKEETAKLEALAARSKEAEARQKAEVAQQTAEKAKEAEEYEAYIARVGLAAAKIDENAFDVAVGLLNECPPALRNWEWGRLMHLCRQASQEFEAQGPVDAVAVSPDGTKFIAGSWDHRARIWDLSGGKPLLELPQTGLYVHAVAWSPDGRVVVTAGNDPEARLHLWDAQTGAPLAHVNGHTDAIVSTQFSPDGHWLLTTSYDQTARLWDVSRPEQPREVAILEGHNWWVWDGAFSPDFNLDQAEASNRIYTVSQDGKAIVWKLSRNPDSAGAGDAQTVSLQDGTGRFDVRQEAVFPGHQGPVYSVTVSPDGRNVATAGYDKRILLWRPEEIPAFDISALLAGRKPNLKFREFSGHTAPVQAVAFSADGQVLVSGSRDNSVKAWSVATGEALKTFRGHHSGVRCVAMTADGRRIISGAQDQRAIVWSIDDYEEIRVLNGRRLAGHADAVLHASFSRDGSEILTSSRDRTARTWKTATGDVLQTFSEGHDYLTSRAVIFPDGRTLATAAADNTVRLWNVVTGTQFLRLDHTGRAAVLALSPDGRWLVTGSEGDHLLLWDVHELMTYFTEDDAVESADRRPQARELGGHHGRVTAAAFSPAAPALLCSCDGNGRCILRNVDTDTVLWTVKYHTRRINDCAFLPDGSEILTASNDHTVGRVRASDGRELVDGILKHDNVAICVTVSEDGRRILTVEATEESRDKHSSRVHAWDASSGSELVAIPVNDFGISNITFAPDGEAALAVCSDNAVRRLPLTGPLSEADLEPWLDFQKLGGLVWYVLVTADRNSVLTVGGSEARLWDVATRQEKMSFSPHGAVAAADFSPDGKHIITGSWDNSAKIWNAQTAQAVLKLENGHDAYINSAVYSPDGRFILTASDDGTAKLWSAERGEVLVVYRGHRGRVRQAVFSPDGKRVLTVGSDRTARLWETESGQPVGEPLMGHRWSLLCGTFSPDGQRLLTGSEDNDARLWNADTGELIATFQGHTAAVTSVAFSSDGLRVFTASQDNTAKLWDASPEHEGKEVLTLTGHSQELTSIAVSPDGREVLTSSRDGTAILWLTSDWAAAASETAQASIP